MREIRLTLRSLARTPLYTLTAIVSLALGIGATTAIFSMMDRVLMRQLAVREPGELAFVYHPGPVQGSSSTSEQGGPAFSYPSFRELRTQQTPFTGLAGSFNVQAGAAYNNSAANARALLVSGNYFRVLGVNPAMGRLFEESDDREPGAHPLVVLTHGYWTSRFGADTAMLNQTMVVNGRGMTIVGVTEKGFIGEMPGTVPDVFVPITMAKELRTDWNGLESRQDYWVTLFGRLKPGQTLESATTAMNAVYQPQLRQDLELVTNPSQDFRQRFAAKKIVLKPGDYGRGQFREQGRRPLQLLLAMTLLVLLIACANVANLQLTRSLARTRETAVRLALGASRGQLVARMLVESAVVAVSGGLLGLLVAWLTLRGILSALPPRSLGPNVLDATLDVRMLGFALVLAVATSLVFGLYPALQASRAQVTGALKDQSGQTTANRTTGIFRKALVTLQTAVSLLLLISAGLFGKTLLNLSKIELGVRVDHLLTFSVAPRLNGYDDARTRLFTGQLLERLRALPGVASASVSRVPAIAGSFSSSDITVDGFKAENDTGKQSALNEVAPDYFRTLGMALVAGREFTDADRFDASKVAIVNEAFVRHFIGNRSPLGVRVYRGGAGSATLDTTIVGVIKDAKYSSMKETPQRVMYNPLAQSPRLRATIFYVRTHNDPLTAAGSVRGAVASLDPNLPITNLRTMQAQIDANVANERLLSQLTGSFAALATLLAAIGLYGVLAFNVARRTREIGIRMALGASLSQVRRLVVREVLLIIGIGIVAGLTAAWFAGALVQSMLFGTTPADPWVFGSAAAALMLIALAAAYVPARRATGVDPMIALRYE